MFKNFVLAVLLVLFTSPVLASEASQMWRLEVFSSETDIVEIAEIQLRTTAGGSNVTQLFVPPISHTQSVASDTWTITHGRGDAAATATAGVDELEAFLGVDPFTDGDPVPGFPTEIAKITMDKSDPNETIITFTNSIDSEDHAIIGVFSTPPQRFTIAGDHTSHFTAGLVYTVSGFGNANDGDYTASLVSYEIIPDETRIEVVEPIPLPGLAGIPIITHPVAPITYATTGTYLNTAKSKDTPTTGSKITAVPVILGFERRPEAAAFDNNLGSKIKSDRAPTFRSPLILQYTFWVGDAPDPGNAAPAREAGSWPNVVEYAITAPKKNNAPKSWRLMYWKAGGWKLADEQAAMRFEDGETRVFATD